ncbi:MAG: PAS domain S-box protein [Spirochaetia bacterium]|nr:PAS domain S-box protein [Spirochaetia bacterium]
MEQESLNKTEERDLRTNMNNLKISEEKYRLHLKLTPLGIIEWDKNFRVIEWNPAAEKIFGYTRKEALGKHPADIIIPVYVKEHVDKLWASLLKKKGGESSVNQNLTKKGQVITCEWHNTTLTNDEGNVVAVVSIVKDITGRIKIEEALAESERRYREIIGTTLEGYWLINTNLETIDVNESLCKMLGYSREEMLGKKPVDFVDEENAKIFRAQTSKISTTLNRSYEIVLKSKSGEDINALFNATTIKDKNGKPAGGVAFVTDITELKKSKFEAEEANMLKDKFLALVSHDLKNPLNGVMGYFQMLEDVKSLTNEEKDWVHEGLRAAEEMNDLITQVLNVSRIKSGKIKTKPVFFSAERIVQKIIKSFTRRLEQKGIKIVNELPLNTRIYADEHLFLQALSNVISNAIKFCSNADTIRIYEHKENPVTIAVEDTGAGIGPENLPLLFKYEEKTSTRGTHGESGTGLGLPLVNDIMRAHKGRVYAESAPKEGSTFYLQVPKVTPRILLVDDSKAEREFIKKSLEKLDLHFSEAETGLQALEALEKEIPHLILLDVKMPDMDGFEFLEIIREKELSKTIPVLVITIDDRIETRNKIFALGADDFIAKPMTMENFEPRIRRFTG